jgi:hypothetical protein
MIKPQFRCKIVCVLLCGEHERGKQTVDFAKINSGRCRTKTEIRRMDATMDRRGCTALVRVNCMESVVFRHYNGRLYQDKLRTATKKRKHQKRSGSDWDMH